MALIPHEHSPRCTAWLTLCAFTAGVSVAAAQPAPTSEPQAPPAPPTEPLLPPEPAPVEAPAVAADDEAALAAALAADAQAARTDAPQQPTEAAPTAAAPSGNALNPHISFTLDAAFAWFSQDEPLQTGHHDPAATGFTLQQAELALQHVVDPYFRLDGYIVLDQEGVELEEAYATTLALPASLQVRAGLFLTRFGRINHTHPHAWDFLDQPFSLGRVFGGEGNGGPGIELSWLTPLPWYVELVGSLTDARGSPSFYGDEDLDIDSPLDFQATAALEQFFALTDDWSLVWGLSTAHGPNPSGTDTRSEVYGTDLYLKWRPITYGSYALVALQVEAIYRRRELPGDWLQDVGGYAQLSWRFTRRWATALRYEHGSPTWDEHGDRTLDTLDPEWPGERKRGALSLSFYPSEFSRLRLQGALDTVEGASEPGWALMLAGEFSVGAHGAHPF